MKWAEHQVHVQITEKSLLMFLRYPCKTVAQLTIQLLLMMIFSAPALAQDCTPNDITLNSQEEVDNFQANHGPCDSVVNELTIDGDDILILDGLSSLTSVNGRLSIWDSDALTNLNGLSSLNFVFILRVMFNDGLINLNGLSSLTNVAGLRIQSNIALTNLNGLSALVSAGRGLLTIEYNDSLTNLDGLSGLTSEGYIYITGNTALANLDGLSGLTSVQELHIIANNALANLDGLSSLNKVDFALAIAVNNAVANINGLSSLTSVGGSLALYGSWTNIDSLSKLTTVGGDLTLGGPKINNLDGLSSLTSIGGTLKIDSTDVLTNMDGLSALTSLGNGIALYTNLALSNLNGLSGLTSMGGGFSISDNDVLTNLDGLSALQAVQHIGLHDNTSLADCQGLITLVDPIDDYESGPGPGTYSVGIPDVGYGLTIENNLAGCNSVADILGQAPLPEMNAGLNDAWFSPEADGQGFLIITFPEIQQIFLAWFTYDTERPPEDITAYLGEPGHRWLTAQGEYVENVAVLDIFMTYGGVFDSLEPEPVIEPYGEITLEFSTCNAGTVTYDIPSVDRQGVIPIERIVLDNVSLCYMLNSELADEAIEQ
jgi:hypothetical protein